MEGKAPVMEERRLPQFGSLRSGPGDATGLTRPLPPRRHPHAPVPAYIRSGAWARPRRIETWHGGCYFNYGNRSIGAVKFPPLPLAPHGDGGGAQRRGNRGTAQAVTAARRILAR